jgi:hypothetical protein
MGRGHRCDLVALIKVEDLSFATQKFRKPFRPGAGIQVGLKIRALLCDYDGTLAPQEVSRSRSRVPGDLAHTLRTVHESIPRVIVTAKDYSFVRPRTAFADAWSCVYGVETVLRDGTTIMAAPVEDFSGALRLVEAVQNRPSIEYKRTSSGAICGFCAEWIHQLLSSEGRNFPNSLRGSASRDSGACSFAIKIPAFARTRL